MRYLVSVQGQKTHVVVEGNQILLIVGFTIIKKLELLSFSFKLLKLVYQLLIHLLFLILSLDSLTQIKSLSTYHLFRRICTISSWYIPFGVLIFKLFNNIFHALRVCYNCYLVVFIRLWFFWWMLFSSWRTSQFKQRRGLKDILVFKQVLHIPLLVRLSPFLKRS